MKRLTAYFLPALLAALCSGSSVAASERHNGLIPVASYFSFGYNAPGLYANAGSRYGIRGGYGHGHGHSYGHGHHSGYRSRGYAGDSRRFNYNRRGNYGQRGNYGFQQRRRSNYGGHHGNAYLGNRGHHRGNTFRGYRGGWTRGHR